MLFRLTRFLPWLIISIFLAFKIKGSKIVRKKHVFYLSVILCMVLISVSSMFPLENLFIDFKSPESVFNYAASGKIDDIIYGKESCMVIYSKGNSTGGHYIMPKSEKGYKIPSYFTAKKVSHKFDRNGIFDVYNVLGTDDYYVIGIIISEENEINVIDSYNDDVKNIVVEMGNDTRTVFTFSFAENFTNDYFIVINGEKVKIAD